MTREERVAAAGEIGTGEMKSVEVGSELILLANVEGKLYAVSDVCTHEECTLSDGGILEGAEVECECHGARFDVTNGEVTQEPAEDPLKTYDVTVNGDDVLVSLD